MIIAVTIILLTLAWVLARPLLLKQDEELAALDSSIDARIMQLKEEFQNRSRELKFRFEQGDLADDEYQKLVKELEFDTAKSLASMEDSKKSQVQSPSLLLTLIILMFIAVVGGLIYYYTGNYSVYKQQQEIAELIKSDPGALARLSHEFEANKNQHTAERIYLAARMKVDMEPQSAEAWRVLGQINARLGRYGEAYNALMKAIELEPQNTATQMRLAEVLAATQDPRDMQTAQTIIKSILEKEPDNQGAWMFYGFNAFALQDYETAIDAWTRVKEKITNNPTLVNTLEKSIAAAKERLAVAEAKQNVAKDSGVWVTVDLPEEIKKKLSGNEFIFVFAKAAEGPRMPLAVQKIPVSQFTGKVQLTDAAAMRPELKMSMFDKVVILARISKSGQAFKQPGDIDSKEVIVQKPYQGQNVEISF